MDNVTASPRATGWRWPGSLPGFFLESFKPTRRSERSYGRKSKSSHAKAPSAPRKSENNAMTALLTPNQHHSFKVPFLGALRALA
ncbi:MAG: hypothetical protein U5K73_12030 [Halofilum sp. (in: g-proteobacteria)]|nr:hypothetical protein [Halofilum sp. (in: g-proteobacteria)]